MHSGDGRARLPKIRVILFGLCLLCQGRQGPYCVEAVSPSPTSTMRPSTLPPTTLAPTDSFRGIIYCNKAVADVPEGEFESVTVYEEPYAHPTASTDIDHPDLRKHFTRVLVGTVQSDRYNVAAFDSIDVARKRFQLWLQPSVVFRCWQEFRLPVD